MTTPPNKPKKRPLPPESDDDFDSIGQPAAPQAEPDLLERYMQAAVRKRMSAAEKPPPPPRLPMLSGIFTFPFYLKTLGAWMAISFGLMLSSWLLMFWLGPGAMLGLDSARLFGFPTCTAALLTFGYAASCCLVIVEETCNGWDSIEVSAGIDWKEWAWNFAHITALVLQAAVVGHVVRLVSGSQSWLPLVVGTLAALPLVILGALAADGAWVPMAIVTVLRSLVRHPLAWGCFYLETAAMIFGWTSITATGLQRAPWLAPFYAASLLAAIILIYARLVGRLAGCIAAGMLPHRTKGDERDD